MANFPDIENPSTLSVKTIKASHRTTAEDGKPYARAKHTEALKEFNLSWDELNYNDYLSLDQFFANNSSSEFNYTNHLNSNTYVVIFGDDSITATATKTFDELGLPCMSCAVKMLEV